jgi:hypothetical protein
MLPYHYNCCCCYNRHYQYPITITYLSVRVGILEIVDELRQVLNAVDVVVRWRADEANSWCCVPVLCNVLSHFVTRQLTALPWLGALCHLDLNLVAVGQVVRGHTKPAACHLL